MKAGISPRTIALFFPVVLALYLGAFYGVEHWRHRQGPWTVTFTAGSGGEPVMEIAQPALGVRGVRLVLHEERATNAPGTVAFDRVGRAALFGRVIYEDLTSLPGVVTFDLLGHEVELLPRVLIVNKREVRWEPDTTLALYPTNKPARPPQPPKKR
jgi:hypothetical protein